MEHPQPTDADGSESRAESVGKCQKQKKSKDKVKKTAPWYTWGIKILVLSFVLSALFSFITEITITGANIAICIVVIVFLLCVSILTDILATAVTACQIEPFLAMASRKIKGSKRAVYFCKNADRFASIIADVLGDICGIISGSAGAALVVIILTNGAASDIFWSILITAIISAMTVGGKAFGKVLAINYSSKIVFGFAKFTTIFKKEK